MSECIDYQTYKLYNDNIDFSIIVKYAYIYKYIFYLYIIYIFHFKTSPNK